MPDPRDLLRQALADVRPDPDALERTLKLIETRRRRRRLAVMSTALALGFAALLLVWVAFRPTSGSISTGQPTAPPSATATTSLSSTRCVQATTSGDFDGDGTTDEAELLELVSGPVSCRNGGEVTSHLLSQQIVDGRCRAAIRHVHDVDLRGQFEQLTGQVRQAADAGGGKIEFARLRLC